VIRIGIIGAGPNAAGHATYHAASGRARVVAIADPDAARAEALARQVGARPVADYQAMLGDVDAVVVASPNFLHREQAIRCAEAGRHVYCEKPLGLSAADARAVAAAVRGAGVRSQVGFSVRLDPTIQEMKRRLAAGDLGAPVCAASRRLMRMDPAAMAGWRADPAKSGGLLCEINIHEIDWLMFLLGDVRTVYARTAAVDRRRGANDDIWTVLGHADGSTSTHDGSWRSSMPMFYRFLQGADAAMSTNEWGNELYLARGSANRETVPLPPGFDLRGNFLDAIDGRAAAACDVDWGVAVMTVADAIIESARSGTVVHIGAAAQA